MEPDYMTAREQSARAIIENPAPVERFKMHYPLGLHDKTIRIYDGAQKLRGEFPLTPTLRKIFGGKLIVTVKAKIIDGQFELMKVIG